MTERFGLGISNCRGAAGVVSGVQTAEQLGAEIAFVAEDINCRDAFQLLALSAARTERIRLATGVVNPYTRNPTSLAMSAATLDEVSGGRAVLGLGTSSPSLIEGQMGIAHGKTSVVMREATEIVRRLLAGETVSFTGSRFTYAGARLEAQPVQPRVPIYFAAMGPVTLRLAGRLADGVLLNVGATPEYVRWAVQQIERGAREAGRDPSEVTVAAWMTAYVTEDYEAGLKRAKEWLATMLSIPRQGELLLEHAGGDPAILEAIRREVRAYPHDGDAGAAAAHLPAELAARMTLIGSPHAVRERVQAYREAGVDVPVLGLGPLQALLG